MYSVVKEERLGGRGGGRGEERRGDGEGGGVRWYARDRFICICSAVVSVLKVVYSESQVLWYCTILCGSSSDLQGRN